jgi:hypothetical protein
MASSLCGVSKVNVGDKLFTDAGLFAELMEQCLAPCWCSGAIEGWSGLHFEKESSMLLQLGKSALQSLLYGK